MEVGLMEFLTIFVLTFALFMLIAGIFTAYFGSGKSRKIGGGMAAGGIGIGILWFILSTEYVLGNGNQIITVALGDVIVQSLLIIVAAVIGALAAIGLFLLAIMKS